MTDREFKRAIALLAVLRIAPALVVLAANGRSLPGVPGYGYGPPAGDTFGFYAAAREFISVWTRVSKPLLGLDVLLLAAGAVGARLLWRKGRSGEAVTLAAGALGIFLAVGVHEMGPTGAGAVGWPIAWSLPLFPLRVVGALGYHAAYYLGIVILLACNIVTVAATALIARRLVPGRLALVAPALLVVWPFVMRWLEGTGNDVYESWLVDSGNLLYSEPLSTALVATALALLILRRSDGVAAALAGALVAASVAVRVSNVTIAAVVFLVLVFAASRRVAILFTLACAGAGTIAAEFWSHGYATFKNHPSDQAPNGLFSWHYLARSWRDSNVFDWKMLVVLLPLPIVGVLALRRRRYDVWLLAGVVIVTAAFYSAYYVTAVHPRFLFVALPPLFVLAAAGVERVAASPRTRSYGETP
jgi:hypothetical protein